MRIVGKSTIGKGVVGRSTIVKNIVKLPTIIKIESLDVRKDCFTVSDRKKRGRCTGKDRKKGIVGKPTIENWGSLESQRSQKLYRWKANSKRHQKGSFNHQLLTRKLWMTERPTIGKRNRWKVNDGKKGSLNGQRSSKWNRWMAIDRSKGIVEQTKIVNKGSLNGQRS